VAGVVKKWYRTMAKKFHPDRTMDKGEAMKAINTGYELLQELFGVSR
jgi:curved DNA-binding protein CbpA